MPGKPLELVVFKGTTCRSGCCEKYEDPRTGYLFDPWETWPSGDKRLTDRELAAEVWHSNFTYMATDYGPERADEATRSGILHRMATHPHYDDEGLT